MVANRQTYEKNRQMATKTVAAAKVAELIKPSIVTVTKVFILRFLLKDRKRITESLHIFIY